MNRCGDSYRQAVRELWQPMPFMRRHLGRDGAARQTDKQFITQAKHDVVPARADGLKVPPGVLRELVLNQGLDQP